MGNIDDENDMSFYYEQTVCVGEYKSELALEAKRISTELKNFPMKRFDSADKNSLKENSNDWKSWPSKLSKWFGQDWMFLLCLAIFVGSCAFAMDTLVSQLRQVHYLLLNLTGAIHWSLQYFVWVGFSLVLVMFSMIFCHFVAPQAIGSGIPEMKTIFRGVVLKEYLTLKTLISKVIGLSAALSSGLPIGKEGPLVHIASIFGMLTSKMIKTFNVYYMNESRKAEMLSAACAVGVASCFGAPVGGVLFSIEGTTSYFAVRNYWRGFFAATCSTIVYQFLSILASGSTTFSPFYPTYFDINNAFDPLEIFFYAVVGLLCGIGGPLFVFVHRNIILHIRNNKYLKKFFRLNQAIYPAIVTIVIITVAFPPASGRYMDSSLTTKDAINDLFANFTWTDKNLSSEQTTMIKTWMPYGISIYVTLILFMIYYFFGAALSNTIPIPAGVFVPVFIIGAALGRMFGEGMAEIFPDGLRKNTEFLIRPGSYALVGAASFAGSVTHTISTAIITFEMTGQLIYLVPVMLGVLISNGVAGFIQPSIYDSIIQIRKLPYMPDIKRTTSKIYTYLVEEFMVKNVQYLTIRTTYRELQNLLQTTSFKAYPVVDRPSSMILLGLMPRPQLETVLQNHLDKYTNEDEKPKKENIITRKLSRYSISFTKDDPDDNSLSPNPNELPNTESLKQDVKTSKKRLLSLPSLKYVPKKKPSRPQRSESLFDPLDQLVDFSKTEMDAAPIQFIEKTPLAKVHILFSLLRLHQVYVTRMGRLVGVVSLNELREALLKSSRGYRKQSFVRSLQHSRNHSLDKGNTSMANGGPNVRKIPSLAVVSEVFETLQNSEEAGENQNIEINNNLLNVPNLSRQHLSSETSANSGITNFSLSSSIIFEDDSAEEEDDEDGSSLPPRNNISKRNNSNVIY